MRRRTGHIRLYGEQAPSEALPLTRVKRGGSHVEDIAILTAKGAVGWIGNWHLNHSIHLPIGRDAHDASPTITAIPKVAIAVDSGTIGQSPAKTLKERLLTANGAVGQVVVIAPDQIL
jgi:hypothetical protein